jgi:hypothetical protein
MKIVASASALGAVVALAASGWAPGVSAATPTPSPAQVLPVDQETTIAGVQIACTGMGETRLDAKWTAYPVRVEFSNAKAEYLTDAELTLKTAKGQEVLKVSCAAPWVLLKPPAGAYAVNAQLLGSAAKPRSAPFKTPGKGQIRVVIAFPDA